MTTKSKAGATTQKRLFTSRYKPPTAAARKNAEALAAIVRGVVVDAGPRALVSTYSSKKLPKIAGSVECRGPVVSVFFEDISARDAGAMLAALALTYGKSKKRGGKR
jgi:uncharacterized protein YodC (DUF2158 family)